MNKTKKYTLIFVVVCFLLIGGVGIYHAYFASLSQSAKQVTENTENQVQQEMTDSKQKEEVSQEKKEEQENQTSQQEKKEEQVNQVSQQEKKQSSKQKLESQSTQQKQTTTSNQETSTSHQTQVEDVPEKEEEVYIEEEIASVYVTITGVDGVMAQDYIEYEEGISAYDALKILADNYEIPVSTSGIGQAIYVKGINGLMEFDYGGMSGWKYKVNGTYPQTSAGACTLKDGDQVEWVYSTNG